MFAARLFRNIRMDPGARPGEYLGARLKRPGVRLSVCVRTVAFGLLSAGLCVRVVVHICVCVCVCGADATALQ